MTNITKEVVLQKGRQLIGSEVEPFSPSGVELKNGQLFYYSLYVFDHKPYWFFDPVNDRSYRLFSADEKFPTRPDERAKTILEELLELHDGTYGKLHKI